MIFGVCGTSLNMAMRHIPNPPAIIPDVIRLADGREFSTIDLLSKVTRPIRIGPDGKAHKPRTTAKNYTDEERAWQARAPVAEIQQRYDLTQEQAKRMQYNVRHRLGLTRRTAR